VYPSHLPVREYQFSMAQQALFSNTLCVLPTGMGKTLIAAVVMFNYFRCRAVGIGGLRGNGLLSSCCSRSTLVPTLILIVGVSSYEFTSRQLLWGCC